MGETNSQLGGRSVPQDEPEGQSQFVANEVFESRFKMTELLFQAGRTRYGLWEPPEIRLTGSEPTYNVPPEHEHRPDLIAQFFYGSVDYWWAIMSVNNILLPIRDLVAGITIVIPEIDEINSALERTRK